MFLSSFSLLSFVDALHNKAKLQLFNLINFNEMNLSKSVWIKLQ